MNPRSWKYGTGWLGGTPLQQKERQTFVVHGNFAWHIGWSGDQSDSGACQRGAVATGHLAEPARLHQSGHGAGSEPDAIWRWEMAESGRDGATTAGIEKVTMVSATVLGKYQGERDDQQSESDPTNTNVGSPSRPG